MLGHRSRLVEFELMGEDTCLSAHCAQSLVRSLERVMGIEDITLSCETQRILLVFHPGLITVNDLGEKLAELGYVVRRTKVPVQTAFPRSLFLH